ncbi:MAG: apolipoprotein N-acyltransferase [Succinivibrionaceae bacterium]|nr:apolipoprotein N-acyltransferase [Succinivibrionaceae bacterium]
MKAFSKLPAKLKRLKKYLLPLAAGAAGSLSFAPYSQPYAIYVSLAMFFHLLYRKKAQTSRCWALLAALCFCTVFWINLSMTAYSGVPLILAVAVLLLFSLYLTSYHALVIYLANRIFRGQLFVKNVLAIPSGFILADYAAGHALTGFPWVYLGYTQIDTPLRNLAPVTGVHGITLVMLLACALAYHGFYSRRLWYLAAATLPVMAAIFCQHTYTREAESVRITMVQGNIQQQVKWDPEKSVEIFETYYRLSQPYFRGEDRTDILVWPESAIPEIENNVFDLFYRLDNLAHSRGFSFLTGFQTCRPSDMSYFNAVVGMGVQDLEGRQSYSFMGGNRYYKRHLVPFGEKVPFPSLLRRMGKFFNMPMSSFSNGDDLQPNITAGHARIASAICYEVAFPDEMQENIHDSTNLLLSLSNDGWFGTYDPQTGDYYVSAGPYQHAQIARMRALEFQKPMARVTNNGLSAIFDADGGTLATLPFYRQGAASARVTLRTGSTPFGTHGFAIIFSIVLGMQLIAFSHLLILMIVTERGKGKKRDDKPREPGE